MIDRPLSSLAAWSQAFSQAEIPVLESTVLQLNEFARQEEEHGNVDAHSLSEAFSNDPLMTLRVLTHVSSYCTKLSVEPPETLVGALVMMGIGPFFKTFHQHTPSAEQWLAAHPEAFDGLKRSIKRSRRAANLAMELAIRRQDEDASVIHEAALLLGFTDMLLWCHAPTLAVRIESALAADSSRRSAATQQEVLGISLADLAQDLMHRWQLPDLLIRTTNERDAHLAQVQTVVLAGRIARHTQYGLQTQHALAARPSDVADLAKLLTLSEAAAARLLESLAD